MKAHKPLFFRPIFPASILIGLSSSTLAQTVWNVNVGSGIDSGQVYEITTSDNYVGAATENTANSTWNAVNDTSATSLVDSSGGATSVTIDLSDNAAFSSTSTTVGDEVFKSWVKDDNNSDPWSVTFANLSTTSTYEIVIYSGWIFGPESIPIEQTAGTGLAGTFTLNSLDMEGGNPLATGVAEDTNSGNVAGDFNFARFGGLTADGTGNLSFTIGILQAFANDFPINGFQLIQLPPDPNAGKIWNVNIGNNIDETDDYVGAASENTANSVWNSIDSTSPVALQDSLGNAGTGVTFQVIPAVESAFGFGSSGSTVGDEIFLSWMKDNNDPYKISFDGLSTEVDVTYSLVIYSGWFFGPDNVPVSQTVGNGLTGTFNLNSLDMEAGNPLAMGLAEDADPANLATDANFARFDGLTADSGGILTFAIGSPSGVDAPVNGFQLIKVSVPSGASLIDFTYNSATGNAEVSIEGVASTNYWLVEADDLDFSIPDQDPILLTGATVGTLDGSEVTTDANGDATVQFNLGTTKDATFLRAETAP